MNFFDKFHMQQTKEFYKKLDTFHNYAANKKIMPHNTILHIYDLMSLCICCIDDIFICDKQEIKNIFSELTKINNENDRTKILILINKIKVNMYA